MDSIADEDPAGSPRTSTPRVVIVVARHRPDLHAYFDEAFAGIQDVMVIRDRRIGDSRAVHPLTGAEPRDPRDRYTELQDRGFIIIRVGDAAPRQ